MTGNVTSSVDLNESGQAQRYMWYINDTEVCSRVGMNKAYNRYECTVNCSGFQLSGVYPCWKLSLNLW